MDILAAVVGAATAKTEEKPADAVAAAAADASTEKTESKPAENGGDAVPKKEEPPVPKVVVPTAAAASTEAAKVEEEDSVIKDILAAVKTTEEHNDGEEDSATHGTAEEEATVGEDSKSSDAPVAAASKDGGKVTVVKAKKVRRKKARKPPNYPKRPLSAYNIFFKDTRADVINEHGKTNFQDMVRLIAAAWKETKAEDKKKYEALAAEDLMRYKKQVGEYEAEAAEKKRAEEERIAEVERQKRQAELRFVQAQHKRNAESASGVRLGADAADHARLREHAMLAAMSGAGGAMPVAANPRELEMARLGLEHDLRRMEEARALRLRQLELAHLQGGGAGMMAGLRGPGGAGMFGGPSELEMELQRRFMAGGGGGDPLAMANEFELRQRLAMMRNPAEQAMVEEQEKLLRERESALGASLGAAGLGGRFGGLGGMGAPGMGMGNPYEEILLREQMLRREREALLLGGGGAGSLYGGALGAGAGGLGSLGLGASSGMEGSNSAAAKADMHTNAAAAGLASLRAQSSYVPGAHLERLSNEQLRALSTDGGGASAFKPLASRGDENKTEGSS